jgi:hypothetical protein
MIGGALDGTSLPTRTVPRALSPLSRTRLWASGLLSRKEQHAFEDAVSPVKRGRMGLSLYDDERWQTPAFCAVVTG